MNTISVRNWNSKFIDVNANLNLHTYANYLQRIQLLATTLYEWEGLPDEISKRFVEKNLFNYGKLAFFYDDTLGYMITKCTPSAELNIYDEPTGYTCYGINYNKFRKAEDVVIIRNNVYEIPTTELLDLFCVRISDLMRTIDTNIYQQKIPKIIKVPESQRLTMKNMIMKVEANEPYILGSKNLDIEGIETYDTSSPYIADKLFELKKELWTEMLEMLGINNSNTDKRERMIVDEVNSNNQLLAMQGESFLMTRQFACDEIKSKFGINISCKLRHELKEDATNNFDQVEEGALSE